ncbi:outer membrane beta-barrel protein [Candidatus Foliamicus sp.]
MGIRSGSFLLFPSLELGLADDNNIYRLPGGKTQDEIGFVRPRLFGVSQWSNHEIQLDAGLDASYFSSADEENVTNWFASTQGRLDIARDAWLSGGLSARKLHEERGDPDSPRTAAEPISRLVSGARVEGFRRLNRLSLGAKADYSSIAYDDAVDSVTGDRLVQDDRDRDETDVSAWAGWDFTPDFEGYLRATRYIRRYDRLQGEDRYRRDSDGTEIVVGARLKLAAALALDLFGGHRRQEYDRDDRLPKVSGASYGGALTWNVTPLTTIRGGASRTVGESTLRQASGYFSSALELGVDHELRRNLLLGADASVTRNSYVGIERKDNIRTLLIRATWLCSRTMHIDLGYRMQRRDSSLDRDDYTKNFVYLDVRFQL